MNPKQYLHILQNMGWRYAAFRVWHETARRSGALKRRFPQNPPFSGFITLPEWQETAPAFFFSEKSVLEVPRQADAGLREQAQGILEGRLQFFNAAIIDLGTSGDWLLNPSNGYRYDGNKHWTQIPDFSPESGDIKYVWEKSRFSWVHTLLRDDYHNDRDHAEFIFSEIDSWIAQNPINQGPNWRCSQEISLRVLNWTFALYYYRRHIALTPERFDRIMHAMYWQLRHVRANIHFSRIAVRNNHAITETLMLYASGLLFPFFPEAGQWKAEGKKWLEEELLYQIYEDGSYLQHSMNYHRVVIQLLTLALRLSELHGERFSAQVYARAEKSLFFLKSCILGSGGQTPNYGNNDGALFFPLSSCDYRDYRPALNALHAVLHGRQHWEEGPWQEEAYWWAGAVPQPGREDEIQKEAIQAFPEGGYFILRSGDSASMIRCARFRQRPAQADNLHCDVWYQGQNLLRDAGTFRYNAGDEVRAYFSGALGHNTVTLGAYEQMQKGPRFIWYYWTKALDTRYAEHDEYLEFEGMIRAFGQLGSRIWHRRRLRQFRHAPVWQVEDEVDHLTGLPLQQYWQVHPDFISRLRFEATDALGAPLTPHLLDGWYSDSYGVKEPAPVLVFTTPGSRINTRISLGV